MKLTDTMERTLQIGNNTTSTSVFPRPSEWPTEFRDPVDAALHAGTPAAIVGQAVPERIRGPLFFG